MSSATKKIYIAGPMTGYENFNRDEFDKVSFDLSFEYKSVLNPAILPNGLTQGQYMDICFAMIRAADAIYLLKGYEESKGAMAELAYAEKLGLDVIKQ